MPAKSWSGSMPLKRARRWASFPRQQDTASGAKARLEAERDQAERGQIRQRLYRGLAGRGADRRKRTSALSGAPDRQDRAKTQLNERIGQLGKEIEGLQAQLNAKESEVNLMKEEFARVDEMYQKSLVRDPLLTSERDLTRLQGERGQLVSSIARAQARSAISRSDHFARPEHAVGIDEGASRRRSPAVRTRRTAQRCQGPLDRIDIRAPRAGLVHELQVHSRRTSFSPAGNGPGRRSEATRNSPWKMRVARRADIDQVAVGQKAVRQVLGLGPSARHPDFSLKFSSRIAEADLTPATASGVAYSEAPDRDFGTSTPGKFQKI